MYIYIYRERDTYNRKRLILRLYRESQYGQIRDKRKQMPPLTNLTNLDLWGLSKNSN